MCLSDDEDEEASAARTCPPTTSSHGVVEEQTEVMQQPLTNHVTCATPTNGHVTSATPTSNTPAQATPTLKELGYQTFHRYYHVFQEGELARLVGEAGGARVLQEFYDHENWCVLAEKVMHSS